MVLTSQKLVQWLRKHQRISHALIAFVWAALFILLFLLPGSAQRFLQMMDYHFADRLAVNGRLTPQNPSIVFLGIDDASIQLDMIDPKIVGKDPVLSRMQGTWPW